MAKRMVCQTQNHRSFFPRFVRYNINIFVQIAQIYVDIIKLNELFSQKTAKQPNTRQSLLQNKNLLHFVHPLNLYLEEAEVLKGYHFYKVSSVYLVTLK